MLLNTVVKSVKRKSHRGDQSVTTDQITTDIIACVNESMRDLAKMLPKQFFWEQGAPITVSAGVAGTPALVSLASDVQEPIAFWYTLNGSYYKLFKIQSDQEWLGGIWNPSTSTAQPLYFREIGPDTNGYKQIEIFPIPSVQITLNYEYYRTKTADLSTSDLNSNIPDLPDYLQDAVEKGALYYFLKGFDDPGQGIAKTDYDASKEAYEHADELNADNLPTMRWPKRYTWPPGFRLR